MSQKAEDWKRVQDELPEHAQHITDIAKVFGRPAQVVVTTDEGEVVLNSEQYR